MGELYRRVSTVLVLAAMIPSSTVCCFTLSSSSSSSSLSLSSSFSLQTISSTIVNRYRRIVVTNNNNDEVLEQPPVFINSMKVRRPMSSSSLSIFARRRGRYEEDEYEDVFDDVDYDDNEKYYDSDDSSRRRRRGGASSGGGGRDQSSRSNNFVVDDLGGGGGGGRSRSMEENGRNDSIGGGGGDGGFGLDLPSPFGRRSGLRLPESVSKALLAGIFVLGIGTGVTVDSAINTNEYDLASRDAVDRNAPNPNVCMSYGASAMAFDQRVFVTFDPFNVYVAQADVKPACVLRPSNVVPVLRDRKLINDDEVRSCKANMNTWAFVGDLGDMPQLSCVYKSDDAQNEFLSDPKLGIGEDVWDDDRAAVRATGKLVKGGGGGGSTTTTATDLKKMTDAGSSMWSSN